MIPFNSEEYFISHLLSINDTKYCIGLFQQEGLLVKGEWVIRISKNENSVYERFDYNLKTKELKMSKKENTKSEFISVVNPIIESKCVIDVSNDGMRWEGSCLNHSPFGYGLLYNSSNELIYRGVMIGDKKECFGIELFPDLGHIEYCGCYWNNERHGYGMSYDREGELVYEGDFIYGSSDFERSVVLKDSDDIEDDERSSNERSASDDEDIEEDNSSRSGSDDDFEEDDEMSSNDDEDIQDDIEDTSVHSLISELVIDDGYGNMLRGDLLLCEFVNLERLVIKNASFQKVTSLKISDNGVLNSIKIEENSFLNATSLTLESMMIYD